MWAETKQDSKYKASTEVKNAVTREPETTAKLEGFASGSLVLVDPVVKKAKLRLLRHSILLTR